jgi:hypothetical protein
MGSGTVCRGRSLPALVEQTDSVTWIEEQYAAYQVYEDQASKCEQTPHPHTLLTITIHEFASL